MAPATNPKVLKKIREMQLQKEATKDISFRQRMIKPPGATDPIFDKEPQKDRIAIFVRDPFWLHATWDITRGAIERSQESRTSRKTMVRCQTRAPIGSASKTGSERLPFPKPFKPKLKFAVESATGTFLGLANQQTSE